jgi:hypothetical protein
MAATSNEVLFPLISFAFSPLLLCLMIAISAAAYYLPVVHSRIRGEGGASRYDGWLGLGGMMILMVISHILFNRSIGRTLLCDK